ncbi:low-density lipoprotein receptor-related protein 5 [Plakobranchus ocellatus]|uniref:Low-density lipoprotein receptor-related protein 5 n=1 Tax=Plakobranchus ocellatus TaxID=259542 RepID=A0AAV4DUC2_9GAST|nr:low-density lipoprotein receptor-related protein 5 [Plakobranchus ocellatus]
MAKSALVILLFLTGCCSVRPARQKISIAVVTSDKSQTRLRLIRDSPKSLVQRLNSLHQGTKSEDIARLPVIEHEWVALDFDYRRGEYFVLDRKNSSLLVVKDHRGSFNRVQLLYRGLSSKVEAIAYDWLRRCLYWGDPAYRSIFQLAIGHMCKTKSCDTYLREDGRIGRSRHLYPRSSNPKRGVITTIIGEDLTAPTSVAVDPINAKLFWADDATLPSIQSSDLDGRNRELVVGGLVRPSGITLDYGENTLYWVERLSGLSVIKKCGLGRYNCVPEQLSSVTLSRLFDMDFHKGFLITTDLAMKRLIIFDTRTDQLLRQNWAGTTHGICVAAHERQPWAELPLGEPFSPESQPSSIPNIREHGALFLSSATTGIWVTSKTFAMGAGQFPILRLIRETGLTKMALDIERGRLFYYSNKNKAIYRVSLPHHIKHGQKTYPLRIVSSWLDNVTGLAVDWATGNLYWLDTGYHRIMICDGHGGFATVLHYSNITLPQDLVIHSEKRLMFWTDTNEQEPRVEMSDLDGYNRAVILSGNVFYERPHALTIDFQRDILYWSDGPYLCSSILRGTFVVTCKNRDYTSTSTVKAMDMMHDFIVWTDVLGGVKLADMYTEGVTNNPYPKTYHSEDLFSDVLYYHSSRQMKVVDPCTTPARDHVKRTSSTELTVNKNSQNSSSSDVNSFIFDTVSFSYTATSTTPMTSARQHSSTTRSPLDVFSRPINRLGQGAKCSHLCLQSRTWTQCACATGYWLKSDGSCTTGVILDEFIIFADLKTGRLFRQFILLPDYYAFPVRGLRLAVDVALCTVEKRVYWLDGASNTIHSIFMNGTHQNVVFSSTTDFNMTQITLASRSRLLYVLTSSGEVAIMSLATKYLLVVVSSPSWAVLDVAVDENRREIFMTAFWKQRSLSSLARSAIRNHGLILRANMDGSDLQEVYTGAGQPWSITLHKSYLLWTDTERHGIYKMYVGSVKGNDMTNQSLLNTPLVDQLLHLPDSSSPNDVIVVGNDVYFTDRTKQAIQKINLDQATKVETIGLSSLNDIAGLAYYNASLKEEPLKPDECAGISIPMPGGKWKCLCYFDVESATSRGYYCQDTKALMYRMAIVHGLCLIKQQAHSSLQGDRPDTYVLPGTVVEVKCDPGYFMESAQRTGEKRICTHSGTWSSHNVCQSSIQYKINGNSKRGYVIFTKSSVFVVPQHVKNLDVICIGGGGGGFDACNKTMRASGHRAGMGGLSSFGHYLRAHGGQGGSMREGGLGGKGRTLFGGQGRLSSECLGGGAAGETTPSKLCQHGSTLCPFCGAGGALPACSFCQLRKGGCGGGASKVGREPGAADDFGGGATGISGGGGGGGGAFSRKVVRVSPQEQIPVTVGKAGSPSAKPAAGGVVVVGWGARLESLVEALKRKTPCKPFTHSKEKEMNCQA